eukprot:177369-Chlamydomonas_euryale.AAC.2
MQAPALPHTRTYATPPCQVVRGADDGVLRAFYNVCSHHAMHVASGAGTCQQLTCGYHGWQYRTDGALRKVTELAGIKGFQPKV